MHDPYVNSLGDLRVHVLPVKQVIHELCCRAETVIHMIYVAAPPLIADMMIDVDTFPGIGKDLLRLPKPRLLTVKRDEHIHIALHRIRTVDLIKALDTPKYLCGLLQTYFDTCLRQSFLQIQIHRQTGADAVPVRSDMARYKNISGISTFF